MSRPNPEQLAKSVAPGVFIFGLFLGALCVWLAVIPGMRQPQQSVTVIEPEPLPVIEPEMQFIPPEFPAGYQASQAVVLMFTGDDELLSDYDGDDCRSGHGAETRGEDAVVVENLDDLWDRFRADEIGINGWETLYQYDKTDIFDIFTVCNMLQIPAYSGTDGSDEPYVTEAYLKKDYDTSLLAFSESGELLDAIHGYDRAADVCYVHLSNTPEYPPESPPYAVAVDTFLDGVYLYTISEDEFVLLALIDNWARADREVQFRLRTFDVDNDLQQEAVLFLEHDVYAAVRCTDRMQALSDFSLPDGTPISAVDTGVVAMDLTGQTDTPFSWYPVLELR